MTSSTAFLDACVLFPFSVRDVLLEFAHREMYRAKWSKKVETETIRNIEKRFPATKGKLHNTFRLMEKAVSDFSAEPTAATVAEVMTSRTDPKDVDHLASAIDHECTHLVTFNLADFDADFASSRMVTIIHPDKFVSQLIATNRVAATLGFTEILKRCKNPPRSKEEFSEAIKNNQMPETAARLSDLLRDK